MLKDPLRVFFLFMALYLLTMGGHIYSPDEEILFRTTESLAKRGSLAIRPLEGFATMKGRGGREFAQYGIGQPLLAIPFYWFGRGLSSVLSFSNAPLWFHDSIQYHGGSAEEFGSRFGVSLFNIFISALLCTVLFSFAVDLTGDKKAAWLAVILFGAGTYAWVHSKPFFTEPLTALLSFWSFYLLYRGMQRESMVRILVAGGLFAYAILVRLDTLFMLPGYVVLIFLHNARGSGLNASGALRAQWKREGGANSWRNYSFLLPLSLSLLAILVLNQIRFGSFFSTGYEDQSEGFRFSTPILGGLYGFLFSAGRGLFFFSPPLVLFFFAMRGFFKRQKNLATALLILVLSFFLIQCKWQNWAGGWCWGPRHIYQIHVFLALPVCLLFVSPRRIFIRCVFWLFLVTGVFVQLLGCSQNFIDYYAEFFTTPRTPPNNYNVWYMETEAHLGSAYALYILDEEGKPMERVPLHALVSPVQNSIYYPQNTAWGNYFTLLKGGRHDFFWLKLVTRHGDD